MNITTRINDPIADQKLIDAYFRWMLLAIAEVAGEHGLDTILKHAGMEKFRRTYASDKLEPVSGLTFGDLADINAGVLQVMGLKRSDDIFHSGRVSARHAMRKNGKMFQPSSKLVNGQLEPEDELRASLETIMTGYQSVAQKAGQPFNAWLKETETEFFYHLESCAICAGKTSTEPICLFFSGSLMESLKWYTGRSYQVVEVACRSMGAPACVWKIGKSPEDPE